MARVKGRRRAPSPKRRCEYCATKNGLVWRQVKQGGALVPVALTNFNAKIITEITEDDGVESRRLFEIEAELNGRRECFGVTADRFNSMSWVTENLGAKAIINPGFTIKDRTRAAIQYLSEHISERTVFTHTGWQFIDGAWVYLHADGAIGGDGPVSGIEVRLPDPLRKYRFPATEAKNLRDAVQASLLLVTVANLSVTIPILGAIYRSVLGGADFSVHISGPTGAGKTAIAALAQQHFGATMDALNLPGSWSSTGNALEAIAFSAKDALFVVDDFAPHGSANDVQRLHREADRLLRAQGNRAGRQRMRADTSLRPSRPPRGLMLSTGEDIPHGQSLRARLVAVEMSRGQLDWERLTRSQHDAGVGLYAQAMSGFLQWVARYYGALQDYRQRAFASLREKATKRGRHKRTTEIVANLQVGVRAFLAFAVEVGVITRDEGRRLSRKSWEILMAAADDQAALHAANDPAGRFLEFLRAAIAAGRAHIANDKGSAPANPAAYGWHKRDGFGTAIPAGDRVGWVSGDDLYLEPDAAYAVVQRMARESGDVITVSSQTLRKRLSERGLLATIDETRRTLTVRRVLGGMQRSVLHLRVDAVGLSPTKAPTNPTSSRE